MSTCCGGAGAGEDAEAGGDTEAGGDAGAGGVPRILNIPPVMKVLDALDKNDILAAVRILMRYSRCPRRATLAHLRPFTDQPRQLGNRQDPFRIFSVTVSLDCRCR